jgi:hypothetical protein
MFVTIVYFLGNLNEVGPTLVEPWSQCYKAFLSAVNEFW